MKSFLETYLKRLRMEKPSFFSGASKITFNFNFEKSRLSVAYPDDSEVIKSDWRIVGQDIQEAIKKYEQNTINRQQLRLSFK